MNESRGRNRGEIEIEIAITEIAITEISRSNRPILKRNGLTKLSVTETTEMVAERRGKERSIDSHDGTNLSTSFLESNDSSPLPWANRCWEYCNTSGRSKVSASERYVARLL